MTDLDQMFMQAAFVAAIAKRRPGVGRTLLMKYAYLLQTVKRVPLGFRFSLYTYGPYDAAVLNRIETAERLGGVTEVPVRYLTGIGYEIHPGPEADRLLAIAQDQLGPFEKEMDWVVEQFRHETAARMELIGTMVFADREALENEERRTKQELVDTVLRIKPKYSETEAEGVFEKLKQIGALESVS